MFMDKCAFINMHPAEYDGRSYMRACGCACARVMVGVSCVDVCTRMRVCMCVSLRAYVPACVCVCARVRTWCVHDVVQVCTRVSVRACACMCVHVRACACIS